MFCRHHLTHILHCMNTCPDHPIGSKFVGSHFGSVDKDSQLKKKQNPFNLFGMFLSSSELFIETCFKRTVSGRLLVFAYIINNRRFH